MAGHMLLLPFELLYYFIIDLYISSDNRNAMLYMCGSQYASIIINCDELTAK